MAHAREQIAPIAYYNNMVERTGFEPVKALPADLQSAPFGQTWVPLHVCGADGGT